MDVIYGDGADLRHCASRLDECGAQIGAVARKSDSGGMDLSVAATNGCKDQNTVPRQSPAAITQWKLP